MRMHLRIKERCSSSSFKQERYQVCKNVCSIFAVGGACVWNCRYAVSLSDRSLCFASLYASLCLSSFTGSLIVRPAGTIRQIEGRALQITCKYYGNGRGGAENWSWVGPAVWQGRAMITHRPRRKESVLRLNPLRAEDNGTYVCLCGSQAATVDIIVHSEYVQLSTYTTYRGRDLVMQDSFPKVVLCRQCVGFIDVNVSILPSLIASLFLPALLSLIQSRVSGSAFHVLVVARVRRQVAKIEQLR